jgi:glycosyltransferase involved in cell wall biosynthesis
MRSRSALLLIPQSPFDTASGAAISERATCEMLARHGWRVRGVCTTATEIAGGDRNLDWVRSEGVYIKREDGAYSCSRRGVEYRLIDAGGLSINEARRQLADNIDAAVESELLAGVPDLVITYGSNEREIRRRSRLRATGSRIAFSAPNFSYISPNAFDEVDVLITPSEYVSAHYARTHGVRPVALPVPVQVGDVTARMREPVFCSMVNPSAIKGVDFFIRVARECLRQGLDVPFLAVESRGSIDSLREAFERTGIDGASLTNLWVVENTPDVSRVYGATRVLLAPSFVEAAGRVVVEAQLNGIPVIASDRGGLPETSNGGGFVLPVSGDDGDPGSAAMFAWVDLVVRLWHDDRFYAGACQRAWAATARYRNGDVESALISRFESFLDKGLAIERHLPV